AFPWPCTQSASLAIQKNVSHRDFPRVGKPICRRSKDIPVLLSAEPIRLACKTRPRLNRKEFFSRPACSARRQSAENALSCILGSRYGLRPFQKWPTLESRCHAKHRKFLEILRQSTVTECHSASSSHSETRCHKPPDQTCGGQCNWDIRLCRRNLPLC